MTRIILVAFVLLIVGTASAQSDDLNEAKRMKKQKELQAQGIQAQESGDLGLAEGLFASYLEWNYNEDVMSRLGMTRLQQGDTLGFCQTLGTPGLNGDLYNSLCTKKDSMAFEFSELPTQTYYGARSVTKLWNLGTGRTSHVLYDEKGELLVSFFTIDHDTVYQMTEQLPEFPGGAEEMYVYLGKTMTYPAQAQRAGFHGKIYIEFMVQIDGHITDARILRGINTTMNAEALRVINAMPDWTPGYHQGGPVITAYIMPIVFTVK